MYFVGEKVPLKDSLEVSYEYKKIAEDNLKAAQLLMKNGLYNDAYYCFIQSMEKSIKGRICEIIDVANPYYADQMRDIGHSLDNAVCFLLRLIAGNNEVMFEHIKKLMVEDVLKGIHFSAVHNNVRYPYYSQYKKKHEYLVMSYSDCVEIEKMEKNLKIFLAELYRIK